jgi:hypothetical protein
MSANTSITLMENFLNYSTSELTAHGLMLFAGLTASITLLKLIYDYKFVKLQGNWKCIIITYFWLIQGFLLGLPIYVLSRLIWYGAVLHQINQYQGSWNNFTTYYNLSQKFFNNTNNYFGPLKPFFTLDLWPRIFCSIGIGIVLSFVLLLPLWLMLQNKYIEMKPESMVFLIIGVFLIAFGLIIGTILVYIIGIMIGAMGVAFVIEELHWLYPTKDVSKGGNARAKFNI